ncbi:MAG: DUF4062 domain-containing protein, partial [bacterium]|nr:DUF4062 domain-containing protein [bacterium]
MAGRVPRVFISSTAEDLRPYRAAARDAAIAAEFLLDMQEYFEAVDNPPLEECLERVSQCDLLVVIVAYRYGWRPDDGEKSITWLECERAKSVVAFLVDEKHDWPVEYREEYRLVEAAQKGNAVEVAAEVQANVKRLADFKQWLSKRAIRASFTNPDDLRGKVKDALRRWRDDHPEFAKPAAPAGKADTSAYRKSLREETAWIDIRGLQTG